jgi:ribonuclease-3
MTDMTELEERIGYEFRDPALLALALATPSVRQSSPDAADNQRLEFLGDAVFGLLVAEALYKAFPAEQEGPLTMRRAHLVSGKALAALAERIDLRRHLVRGEGLPMLPQGAKPVADAMEAVMGAVWLDGGEKAARKVFACLEMSVEGPCDERVENPRLAVQKIAQSLVPRVRPAYEILGMEGPPHEPVITARVTVKGVGSAEAKGRSKAAAEAAAAAALLAKLDGAEANAGGE